MTFFAKDNAEFFKRKNAVFAKYSGIILQKFMGVVAEAFMYPETTLHHEEKPSRQVFGRMAWNQIDDTDRKILAEVFHNARIKLVDLASRTGVTVDVARGRLRKLEEHGIISIYKAVIDFRKLDWESYKAFLYFDSLSDTERRKLFQIVRDSKRILRVLTIIAPWDLELEIRARSFHEFNDIIRRLKEELPNLRNVESAALYEPTILPAKDTIMKL